MTRQRNCILVWTALLLSGCSAAKPARQWVPAYPSMLRSAGYAGTTTVMVRVDRSGHPRVMPSGPSSVIGQHPLFLQAVGQAVRATPWRPARRFGFPHADSALYQVDFVMLRDTLPLGPNELRREGNDALPRTCPRPRTSHHVAVCSTADHVRYRVLY